MTKLEQIKEAVDAGTYVVDPGEIAARMLHDGVRVAVGFPDYRDHRARNGRRLGLAAAAARRR